jgi:YidC/Oxa1 family membrane protein insertase
MGFLTAIFNTVFYQPLFNALILIYTLIPGKDLGIAVILLTILIRILLYPLNLKSIRSQKAISGLEPKLKEIRRKFKDDQENATKAMLELYKKENINPLSEIFLLFLQLPVLIALYLVFARSVAMENFNNLYSFVPHPGEIRPFLLMVDLSKPNLLFAGLSGILQFLQARFQDVKIKTEKNNFSDFSEVFRKQMLYFFPAFTFFILLKIPSAISLYLIVSTGISILQVLYVHKKRARNN